MPDDGSRFTEADRRTLPATHTAPVEIAVIVVNYGTADMAIAAVDSVLARGHGGRQVEVHLVDNASPGADAAQLATAHAERGWGARVTLYPEVTNHGFGRGNNLVLARLAERDTPPEKIFLLNPDARLENEALDILAGFLDDHPQAAFAGAGIRKPDGTQVTAAFRFPRPASEFVRQINFGPVTRLAGHLLVSLPPDLEETRVDWVAGAAVMIRFRTLREIGFFDPAYFLYYEEVDLMHRAARAGWETWYVPDARAIHAEGAATRVRSGETTRPRRPAYWYRSWATYFRGNYGQRGLWLAALSWMLGAAGNHALALLPGRTVSVPLRFFPDFEAVVLRPMIGLDEGRHG